ncbi:hypothetical protein PHSC3_001593 [Chlamydiales bacterium STE3]|nr:hypothetical protein PHSC3_001593 [Chlamydiales bacterium STE3]
MYGKIDPSVKVKIKKDFYMLRWFKQFTKAKRETKWFILNWAVYIILLIATTLYCYARLDYVRSYKASETYSKTP